MLTTQDLEFYKTALAHSQQLLEIRKQLSNDFPIGSALRRAFEASIRQWDQDLRDLREMIANHLDAKLEKTMLELENLSLTTEKILLEEEQRALSKEKLKLELELFNLNN